MTIHLYLPSLQPLARFSERVFHLGLVTDEIPLKPIAASRGGEQPRLLPAVEHVPHAERFGGAPYDRRRVVRDQKIVSHVQMISGVDSDTNTFRFACRFDRNDALAIHFLA